MDLSRSGYCSAAGFCEHCNEISGFHKTQEMVELGEHLLASQEGLCSIVLLHLYRILHKIYALLHLPHAAYVMRFPVMSSRAQKYRWHKIPMRDRQVYTTLGLSHRNRSVDASRPVSPDTGISAKHCPSTRRGHRARWNEFWVSGRMSWLLKTALVDPCPDLPGTSIVSWKTTHIYRPLVSFWTVKLSSGRLGASHLHSDSGSG